MANDLFLKINEHHFVIYCNKHVISKVMKLDEVKQEIVDELMDLLIKVGIYEVITNINVFGVGIYRWLPVIKNLVLFIYGEHGSNHKEIYKVIFVIIIWFDEQIVRMINLIEKEVGTNEINVVINLVSY